MRFAVLTAVALAAGTQAQIIDNLIERAKILAAAVQFDNGEYVVRNAKTGEYLTFSRPGDTTNVHTTADHGTITLSHGSKYGASGLLDGWWSGTILSGMNKCGSAQWGEDSRGVGKDIAFVSYACSVGDSQTGTDTLEVAKQFWRIVPCGSSSSSNDDDDSSSNGVQLNVKTNVKAAANVEFTAKDDEAEPEAAPAPAKSEAAAPAPAAASKAFDKNDRSTWVCKHDGVWLNRHYRYITEGGHVECQDELDAYRATLAKRSTHSRMAMRLRKRAEDAAPLTKRATSGRFCIIAEDHLKDMQTRAVGPSPMSTYGGYTSQALVDYNPDDLSQQWDITPA